MLLDSEVSSTSDSEELASRENNEEEWSFDQLDANASLFRGRTTPKSRNQLNKKRYLPLPCLIKLDYWVYHSLRELLGPPILQGY